MEYLSNIAEYIENIDIKTAVIGGFDKEAVYGVIQDISSMYQKANRELKEENEKLREALSRANDGADGNAPEGDTPEIQALKREVELLTLSSEAAKKEVSMKDGLLKEKEEELARAGEKIAFLEAQSKVIPAPVLDNAALDKAERELGDCRERLDAALRESDALKKEIEGLQADRADLREKLSEAEENAKTSSSDMSFVQRATEEEYEKRFRLLDEALAVLRDCSEKAIGDAEKRASVIISSAEEKARAIEREAAYSVSSITREIESLKEEKIRLEKSVSAVSDKLSRLVKGLDEIRDAAGFGSKSEPAGYGYGSDRPGFGYFDKAN